MRIHIHIGSKKSTKDASNEEIRKWKAAWNTYLQQTGVKETANTLTDFAKKNRMPKEIETYFQRMVLI